MQLTKMDSAAMQPGARDASLGKHGQTRIKSGKKYLKIHETFTFELGYDSPVRH